MKKKLMSMALCAVTAAMILTGCGNGAENTDKPADSADEQAAEGQAESESAGGDLFDVSSYKSDKD